MVLPVGSIVGYGGGWKSFDGEALSEPALIDLIERATGVKKQFVIDGYSMTEIGAIMLKCEHDRFHVPPHLETIILDDALDPVDSNDLTGILGRHGPLCRLLSRLPHHRRQRTPHSQSLPLRTRR